MAWFEVLSTAISFFGGSTLRILWGEISSHFTAKREHENEMARMEQAEKHAAAQHGRLMQSMEFQAKQQVEVIRVQGAIDVDLIDAANFGKGVEATGKPSGITWVDAWNAVIRPSLATWSILMITAHYLKWLTLDVNGWSLTGAALGVYVADRTLFKRGK